MYSKSQSYLAMKFCASSHFVLSSLRMIVFMNITPTRIASAPLHKFEHHIGQKYLTYLRKRGQCLHVPCTCSVYAVYRRCRYDYIITIQTQSYDLMIRLFSYVMVYISSRHPQPLGSCENLNRYGQHVSQVSVLNSSPEQVNLNFPGEDFF